MSKKLIIIISVVLGLFLISLVGYYFIIQTDQVGPDGKPVGFKGFFPFGGGSEVSTGTDQNQPVEPVTPVQDPEKNFTAKLRKLSSEAVSGAGTLDLKAGTTVRYIEKATGHIFEVELFSPNQSRISNTTIPVVYDAVWGDKNNSLVTRYLKDDNQTVNTYTISLKNISTSTENTISGKVLSANISDVSVFGSSIFYLEQGNGFSSGIVLNFDGSGKKQIWNSPIKELLSQYVNAKTVALTTKPFQKMPGFLYLIDTGTGQVKNLLNGVLGLSTSVNPDNTKVLYLEQNDDSKMFVFDQKSSVSTSTTPVTFPEKCVWSKKNKDIIYCAVPKEFIDNTSLTSWYRGLISTTDDIWKYDIKNNISTIALDLSSNSGEKIDVMKPVISDNDQYLVFINKIDNSLWSLDLSK